MNNQDRDYGRLENLQVKINKLRQESVDLGFSKYLDTVQARLDSQMVQAINLENELNQNHQMYLQHFGVQAQSQVAMQPEVQPQTMMQSECLAQPQPQIQPQPQFYQQTMQKQKRNVEFTVGAGLLSIVGVLFILAAFVMLGMTYMGGLFKGLCLYAIAIVVILLSELVFKKRMEKFSLALTGLGLAGLYVSTMINCLYLHNFGSTVAILLTVGISVFVAFLARKKDSGIIKVISFIGCYLCFLPVLKYGTTGQFITMSIILFLINILTIILPVKRSAKAVHITHLLSNMIVTLNFGNIALASGIDGRLELGFVIANLLIIGLVYFAAWKRGQCTIGVMVSFLIALFATTFHYAIIMASDIHLRAIVENTLSGYWYHLMFGLYAVTMLLLFLLFIKNRYKWIYYYFLIAFTFMTYGVEDFGDNLTVKCIAVLSVFVLSKLLSRIKMLQVSEMVISAVTLLYALLVYLNGGIWAHVFAIVILVSIIFATQYKVTYQFFVTISSILYLVVMYHDFSLAPALLVGFIFLLLFAFNNVSWWRANNQLVYNIGAIALVFAMCLLTPLISGYINTVIVAVFGTAIFVLMFADKYDMNFKAKYLLMVLYWSYLVVVTEFETQLIASVILMLIAIASVVMGFALSRKEVRVYGLVASLLVCLKVLFYDFSAIPIQERMLLFLLVGVIILSISFIYILLEKKIANRGE